MNQRSVLAGLIAVCFTAGYSMAESFLPSVGLYAADFDLVRLAPDVLSATSVFQVDAATGKRVAIRVAATSNTVNTWIVGPPPGNQIISAATIEGLGGALTMFGSMEVPPLPIILPIGAPGFQTLYSFPSLGPGAYTVHYSAAGLAEEVAVLTELVQESAVGVNLVTPEPVITLGQPCILMSPVIEGTTPRTGANVVVSILSPSLIQSSLTLLDNGPPDDGAAGDGLYNGSFVPQETGEYLASAVITGYTSGGVPFKRFAATQVHVVQPCGTLGNVSDFIESGGARLAVEAEVNVTTPGEFILDVALETQSGVPLRAYGAATLQAGAQTIRAYVEAEAIRALREDGPYKITEIQLLCVGEDGAQPSGRIISETMQTGAYSWRQFRAGPIELSGYFSDQAIDLVPLGGFWDQLRVFIGLRVARAGDYKYEAVLVDSCGGKIQTKSGIVSLSAFYPPPVEDEVFMIPFSGPLIGQHGFSGPYFLRYLYLHGPMDKPARDSLFEEDIGQTQGYAATGFTGYMPFVDCNNNGQPDSCDIQSEVASDCNLNGVPDSCETPDCNNNEVPDDCEPDCNHNGVADECDITAPTSNDCNENRIPDECEIQYCFGMAECADCNGNGVPDGCEPDCNGNNIADACDITAATSIDCDANGIPDECPCSNCPCPLGIISTTPASPPSLTRDARQPHPLESNALVDRQGIGSTEEPISIKLTTCGNMKTSCFQLCETGREQLDTDPPTYVDANAIASVTQSATDPYTYNIVLTRPISAGHWTSIKYWGGSKRIIYSSLPGDVDGDQVSRSTNPSDVDYLSACMTNPALCPTIYRRDMDRSGSMQVDSDDVSRLSALLSGIDNTFLAWEGKYLPGNFCSQGGGGGPYCPSEPCGGGTDPQSASMMSFGLEGFGEGELLEEGEIAVELTENQEHANALAELLTGSDSTTVAELELFESFVATLTQFAVANFSSEEKQTLADWLTDPMREFASPIGQDAAAEVAGLLLP